MPVLACTANFCPFKGATCSYCPCLFWFPRCRSSLSKAFFVLCSLAVRLAQYYRCLYDSMRTYDIHFPAQQVLLHQLC